MEGRGRISKTACTNCRNGICDCCFFPAGYGGQYGIEPYGPCCSGTKSSVGDSFCCTCTRGTISGDERAEVCLTCPSGSKANVGDCFVRDTSLSSASDSDVRDSCRLCEPRTSSATGYEPCARCPLRMVTNRFGATKYIMYFVPPKVF